MFVNDDDDYNKSSTPERRFARVRRWVVENLRNAEETPT
jgi:hypothetical protein